MLRASCFGEQDAASVHLFLVSHVSTLCHVLNGTTQLAYHNHAL